MTRGIFPLNNLYFDRVPVFVDELNTHCAVAYILKEDNQFEIINNLQQNYNYNLFLFFLKNKKTKNMKF